MKILLLSPSSYSIDKTIKLGFSRLGHQVVHFNYRNKIPEWKEKINTQIYRLPLKFRNIWEKKYFTSINDLFIREFEIQKPDIVFIYNNEMLLPDTLNYFRSKSKIIFFLGDNPFYTPTSKFNLTILFYANLIISPDSFWVKQLEALGIGNCIHEVFGFNDELNFKIDRTEEGQTKFGSEVLFIGNNYVDSWGYKRTLFLNQFKDFNLKIYGTKNWIRWFEFFPELRKKFILLQKPFTFDEVNILSNYAKVYPVEANPGLINGLHIRIFDCIGSGVLPLVEYRRDAEIIFKDIEIPVIKNYSEAASIAKKYMGNDKLRETTIEKLRTFVLENYKPEKVLSRVLNHVG
jgi:spore maturation protein CgeB